MRDEWNHEKSPGVRFEGDRVRFRVLSDRKSVELCLYKDPLRPARRVIPMKRRGDVYELEIPRPGEIYYNYRVDGRYEVTDPSARASAQNSRMGVLMETLPNPPGFLDHAIPENPWRDAVIYEVHVKDFTVHPSAGVPHGGKYLGFVEESCYGDRGFSHLRELGVTHVHLMPVFDYISVDESPELFLRDDNYNWGYDPELYNVPEGSFATRPDRPESRILELKTMIQKLHEAGLSVVMDVVYNHTFKTVDSAFHTLYPFFYYRHWEDGSFSNGSGCGNEIATEKWEVSDFILDSLCFWVEEYRVDGFRFDLMALLDQETVFRIEKALRKRHPEILLYGEPWMALESPLPMNRRVLPGSQKGRSFALFNSTFRDALKGDNDGFSRGYLQGESHLKTLIETGLAGSIHYDEGRIGFCKHPKENINYFNSHDNLIFTDKLRLSMGELAEREELDYHRLAFAFLLTAQGIPFFHAGNEWMRSKKGSHNSYNAPLSVNAMDWTLKEKNRALTDYVQKLLTFRKSHEHFHLSTEVEVRQRLSFIEDLDDSIIGFTIDGKKELLAIFMNTQKNPVSLQYETLRRHVEKAYGYRLNRRELYEVFAPHGPLHREQEHHSPLFLKERACHIFSVIHYEGV